MLDIKLKDKVFNYSIQFNQENNIGVRGHADGNQEEQLVGILGENIVKDALGLPLMVAEGFDGGFDMVLNGYKVDIKTMGRKVYPKPNYINNLISSQLKYDVDIYLFCSYNKKQDVLTVCGWISKEDFISKCKFYKEGDKRTRFDGTSFISKSDLCEIENRLLNPIHKIEDINHLGQEY